MGVRVWGYYLSTLVCAISSKNIREQWSLFLIHPPLEFFFFFFFNATFTVARNRKREKEERDREREKKKNVNGDKRRLIVASIGVLVPSWNRFDVCSVSNERCKRDFNLRGVALKRLMAIVMIIVRIESRFVREKRGKIKKKKSGKCWK